MEKVLPGKEVTLASKTFEKFFAAQEFEDILGYYKDICGVLRISPGPLPSFYPALKAGVRSLCGTNLFQILDKKVSNNYYDDQTVCNGLQVLVIGCGPIGLRTAIEAQLMGAKVTVCEKRASFTRNNVLHLWPFVIEDLKLLGVKQFFPKFCTGSMNHISIRRIQSVLMKVALVLGVQVYENVEFKELVDPAEVGASSSHGWRVKVGPKADHPVENVDVDVLIGAEGKRVTVPGFKRKEFRGKLAIAITANFANRRTTAEAVVEEISGVAFVYKQDFFNSLYEELGIALENIVYYKDETHYFVMTTKKHSLLDRGVLRRDLKDPAELLHRDNVNNEALLEYIKDACDYCTDYQLPNLDFALNHHGEPDVALFDFTSMFAASNSSYVLEKRGRQLLLGLVGDGLLEPFWPTGTGAARGFLGCLDTCHMMQEWCAGHKSVLEILAERESIFRLLPQTTSENIGKDFRNFTPDPSSRYPNLNKHLYSTHQMAFLYISDRPEKGMVPRSAYNGSNRKSSSVGRKENDNMLRRGRVGGGLSAGSLLGGIRGRLAALAVDDDLDDLDYDSGSEYGSSVFTPSYTSLADRRSGSTGDGGCSSDSPSLGQPQPKDYFQNSKGSAQASRARTAAAAAAAAAAAGTGPLRPRDCSRGSCERVDRQVAMDKITETFGYGKGPRLGGNAQNKDPVKKRAVVSKASAAAKATKTVKTAKKDLPGGVERWDFAATAGKMAGGKSSGSALRRVGSIDGEIDPELDGMLAALEVDEGFQNLSENEQLAWLESLFYLDTKSPSSGLLTPSKLPLHGGRGQAPQKHRGRPHARDPAAAKDDQGCKLGQPSGKAGGPDLAKNDVDSAASAAKLEGGLNKDLCTLAQSFFEKDNKVPKVPDRKRPPPAKAPVSRHSDPPQGLARVPQEPPAERAFFQPTDSASTPEDPEAEDDDFMPRLDRFAKASNPKGTTTTTTSAMNHQARHPSSTKGKQLLDEKAPPVPERSQQPKLLMLRLMKTATNALKS